MPETSVHKDRDFPSWEYDVGSTGQRLGVQTIPVSQAIKQASHLPLWTRIFSLDRLHNTTALVWRSRVGHDNRRLP
jgi:hypothetical protein